MSNKPSWERLILERELLIPPARPRRLTACPSLASIAPGTGGRVQCDHEESRFGVSGDLICVQFQRPEHRHLLRPLSSGEHFLIILFTLFRAAFLTVGGKAGGGEDVSSSEGSMANEVQSKRLCCGDIFRVDAHNRGLQKYCPKKACRAAGKAARQRRWLDKPENQDYFRRSVHVDQVRAWRADHPGYWRAHRRETGNELQDGIASGTLNTVASMPSACISCWSRWPMRRT